MQGSYEQTRFREDDQREILSNVGNMIVWTTPIVIVALYANKSINKDGFTGSQGNNQMWSNWLAELRLDYEDEMSKD